MPERSDERKQFLSDITITAIEGGIGYWSWVKVYNYSDELDVRAIVQENDPDKNDAPWFDINNDVIARGIGRVLTPSFKVSTQIRQWIRDDNKTNGDNGMIDSDCADVIVQAALFGEIVYG